MTRDTRGPHYCPRLIADSLRAALAAMPVVVLGGARQAGKTRLALEQGGRDRTYLDFDDIETRDAAQKNPASLLALGDQLTIDEVQRVPEFLIAIKRDVDKARRPGRFLLTGSANLRMMATVSESLAGRAVHLGLWPLTLREARGEGRCGAWSALLETPFHTWRELIERRDPIAAVWPDRASIGGYPTPALELETPAKRAIWFQGYLQTYLERDLRDLAAVENLADFRRLMRALALHIGHQVNLAEVGTELSLTRSTVHRWANLLETSYQIVRIPAFATNRGKRLTKSPKLFWSDVGLAHYLAGTEAPTGSLLENLVLGDLLAWRDGTVPAPELMHWRTVDREEVDFVIEWKNRLLPVEVKATKRPTLHDARTVNSFLDLHGKNTVGGLVLHGGTDVYPLGDRVLAAPFGRVL